MFEFSFHSGNHQDIQDIDVGDVFDEIILTDAPDKYISQGFVVVEYTNLFECKEAYMVKPTQTVIDHMNNTGRGRITGISISPLSLIGFTASWGDHDFTTTPCIAGKLHPNSLKSYKKSAKRV